MRRPCGGDTERFDEARVGNANSVGQVHQRARSHADRVGHPAVGADAEHAICARAAAMALAGETLVALSARCRGIDRDGRAVFEQPGQLVTERERERTVRQHVQVAAADGGRLHAHLDAVTSGVRDLAHLDPALGVADGSHDAGIVPSPLASRPRALLASPPAFGAP